MFVFLSYAEEDREIAAEISDWLGEQGVERFDWLTGGSGRFLPLIEGAISRADAFVALMSPHFMASKWCSRERDMALFREQQLQEDDPERAFVHVLEVGRTRPDEAGFLGAYNWVPFAVPASRDDSFTELARRLGLGRRAEPAAPGRQDGSPELPPSAGPRQDRRLTLPTFRNRDDEFDLIETGLVTSGEKPFWLVTAPPQLGKTWLLKQVRGKLEGLPPPGWAVSMIDVRNLPPALRRDAGALIAKFFGLGGTVAGTSDALRAVARNILQGRRPWLCLLDHAELLDKTVAADFRARISQICQEVLNGRRRGVRLGLIVASRREEEWLGVTPSPRLSRLPLSEFKSDVVQEALIQLAAEMEIENYTDAKRDTDLVYELTQGLPALLTACLEWIQEDGMFDLEPLRSPEMFQYLASPYISGELLAKESLLSSLDRNGNPMTDERSAEALSAIQHAYRVLAPFRLFTRSHVHHYLDSDPGFRDAVAARGWNAEDVWLAVSGTALLARLRELWKVVQPAIRRLLYRYHYPSDEACATVHSEARKIVEVWASQQTGKEQVAFLVECLWHEAMALRRGPASELEQRLLASAGSLSSHFRGSAAYDQDDLRIYAADQIGDDAELQHAVSLVPGLFDRLIEIVRHPPQGSPPPPEGPRIPPKESV